MDSARSPPKPQPAVLARYGGQAGPTGQTNPGAATGSPVSLASFMGGKAAGPRLGKLSGDGKSAPPEYDHEYHRDRRGVPLPGLAKENQPAPGGAPGAKSLASFLEARASQQEPAYRSSRDISSPTNAQIRSVSPVKSQSIQIPPADTKGGDLPAPSRQTPLRGATTSDLDRPGKASSLAAPSSSIMKDAATSPRSASPNTIEADRSSSSPPKSSPVTTREPLAPTSASTQGGMVAQRLKEARERDSDKAVGSGASATPASPSKGLHSSSSSTSKWPTVNPASSLAQGSSTTSSNATSKWPPVNAAPSLAHGHPSNTSNNLPPPSRWNPAKSGNALPGLSSSSSSSRPASITSPTRGSYEERSSAALSPVRLPGMGGPVSPFKGDGTASDDRGSFISSQDAISAQTGATAEPLESLTSNRARGPAKRTPRSAAAADQPEAATIAASSAASDRPTSPTKQAMMTSKPTATEGAVSSSAPAPTGPRRSTSGPRIAVLISGSGSNLQALIDATLPNQPLSQAQISYVISNRKAAYGLQRAAQSNPPIPTQVLAFKTWQNKNGGTGTREEYDEVLAKAVLDGSGPPDLIVLAGFMHIVSPQFLSSLGHKTDLPESSYTPPTWRPSKPIPIINLHPALPGAFDGVNAIGRAFEAFQKGEITNTGIMVHEVVAEVDRGAPIVVEQVPIYEDDTLESLEERMHEVEHQLIVKGARITLDKVRRR